MATIDALKRPYAAILRRFPPEVAARVDLLRASYWSSGWGPMNGQAHRQKMVRQIMQRVTFDEVLETGSYRGTTTLFLAIISGVPVRSVEFVERYQVFAKARTAPFPNVSISLDDSRNFLRMWAREPGAGQRTVFAYLDAHWEDELPLTEELEELLASGCEAAILIDDFQVPDDPGYGYDDYGPGKALTLDLAPPAMLASWAIFYPSASAGEETGAKRGSVVLASPKVAELIDSADSLRRAQRSTD